MDPTSQVIGAFSPKLGNENNLISHLYSRVREIIENATSVPSLNSEEFFNIRDGLKQRLNLLEQNSVLKVTAPDSEERKYFVTLQGIVEHVLASEFKKM